MYNALYRGQPTAPLNYFVLSGINSVDGSFAPPDTEELQCPRCHSPVHFYGREAAKRQLLGMKSSDLYVHPRFDHQDGVEEDCPKRSQRKPVKDDSYFEDLYANFSPAEMMARGPDEKILFEPDLIQYVLGVWAHMYGEPNISMDKFQKARELAEREGFLGLRGLEAWRVPYALALPMNFRAGDGRQLRLVPRRLVNFSGRQRRRQFAEVKQREKNGHKAIEPLYVVNVATMDRFSGPHIPLKEKTRNYYKKNASWASRQLNQKLAFV